MTKRLAWIDFTKGVLIILVVLGHSIQCAHMQLGQSFLSDRLWRIIYSFHMPAFMAVSGYVAYRGSHKRMGSLSNCLSSIWRRFRQLMIPFLIWSVALFFVRHNVEHYYEYILNPNLSLWFLWALFFITVIFFFMDWVSWRLRLPQMPVMIVTAAMLLGLMLVVPDAKFLGIEYVSYYFLYYILGYYLHKYDIIKSFHAVWIVSFVVVWVVLAQFWEAKETPSVLSWITFLPSKIVQIGYRIVIAIIAILALFGCMERWSGEKAKTSKAIIELGQLSLGVYAVHMVIRFLIVDGLTFVLPQIGYWPLLALTFVVLLPITYILVWLICKNKWTAELLLGKLR